MFKPIELPEDAGLASVLAARAIARTFSRRAWKRSEFRRALTMKSQERRSQMVLTETATLCFTIAGIALLAVVIGSVVNLFLTGWMAVTGMFALFLFYAALGLLNLSSRPSIPLESAARDEIELPTGNEREIPDPPEPPDPGHRPKHRQRAVSQP